MEIKIQFSEKEVQLIEKYAKENNVSVSKFLREAVLEKIENKLDLAIYDEAMAEHLKENSSISYSVLAQELANFEEG